MATSQKNSLDLSYLGGEFYILLYSLILAFSLRREMDHVDSVTVTDSIYRNPAAVGYFDTYKIPKIFSEIVE